MRLEDAKCSMWLQLTRFQFQCGAIGRKRHTIRADKHNRVSIPVWCDWKPLFASTARRTQGFNSSVVRLEEFFVLQQTLAYYVSIPVWCDWKCHLAYKYLVVLSFNSSVVRLEVCRKVCMETGYISFNSSVVRLEVFCQCRNRQQTWFQFQCGAIGRLNPKKAVVVLYAFQFQCGAIGSNLSRARTKHDISFNSSVVRLEAPS